MKHLAPVLIITALLIGAGLRVVRLERVPLGLYCDEACNGYDAYSILRTGRDHHGNFLPLVIQGFNDERMALFDYSLVPLIGAFGLRPGVVRLGAALWGITDLIAIVVLAGLMLGPPGAVVAAVLVAISPWHLPLSRFGIESTVASATVSLAMACFFLWLKRREDRWLLLSGVFFGLTLYSNPIAKGFTVLILGLLILLYWKELKAVRGKALIAPAIVVALAAPQAVLLWRHFAELQAHFRELSLFNYISTCPGCSPSGQAESARASFVVRATDFGAAWLSYFSPDFLFLSGDKGGHSELLFPPGFGMLLPEQGFLVGFALVGLFCGQRRKLTVLFIGWLVLAALPAALLVPQGAWSPESAGHLPTPVVLARRLGPNVPLTPWLLFAHPEARHDVLAIAPWTLLSALGFVTLLAWTSRRAFLRLVAVGLIATAGICHGALFIRSYFYDYPILAAPYFYYGLDRVIESVEKFRGPDDPVIIDRRIAQGYMQVLFNEHYPPALLQRGSLQYDKDAYPLLLNPHSEPIAFDHYFFEDPWSAIPAFKEGIFVFAGARRFVGNAFGPNEAMEKSAVLPIASVRYADGKIAYTVVYKTARWSCAPHSGVSLKVSADTTICSFSATTPSAGGPWRAIVTWNAIIKDGVPGSGWIECRLNDGSRDFPGAHTSIPRNGDTYWNETVIPSGNVGVYGDSVRRTWNWKCEGLQPSRVVAGLSPNGMSYAQVYFVPAAASDIAIFPDS